MNPHVSVRGSHTHETEKRRPTPTPARVAILQTVVKRHQLRQRRKETCHHSMEREALLTFNSTNNFHQQIEGLKGMVLTMIVHTRAQRKKRLIGIHIDK